MGGERERGGNYSEAKMEAVCKRRRMKNAGILTRQQNGRLSAGRGEEMASLGGGGRRRGEKRGRREGRGERGEEGKERWESQTRR